MEEVLIGGAGFIVVAAGANMTLKWLWLHCEISNSVHPTSTQNPFPSLGNSNFEHWASIYLLG